jgi:hypothetical protein
VVEVGSAETEGQRLVLREEVQLAVGEIAESAKEGLLAAGSARGWPQQECVRGSTSHAYQ